MLLASAIAAALLAVAAGPPARWAVSDPGQGPFALAPGAGSARELSGIAWAGGTRYYAVSDKQGKIFPLSVALDPQSGIITHAAVETGITLPGGTDLEGVAPGFEPGTVLVSDEFGPAIRQYRVADGSFVRTLRLPPEFASARKNLSLESLSSDPERGVLWTANEETLTVDGALSSMAAGSVIRLQRFDRDYQPNGQWAYVTDPLFGDMLQRGRDIEDSGVADLVALPGGGLLVLERAFGAGGLRIRLYDADLRRATDVAKLASLAGASYVPAHKTLLWQRLFANINYEGIALGPALADGARSLLLISDDGHHLRQTLYALSLRATAAP